MNSVARVTKGTVTIPVRIRREAGLQDGAFVGFEVKGAHIIVRPVVIVPTDEMPAKAGPSDAGLSVEEA